MDDDSPHCPVLLDEALRLLLWRPGGCYVDATLGSGGHAEGILKRDPQARVWGFDVDDQAVEWASRRLQCFEGRFYPIHSNFTEMASFLKSENVNWVDGILADLGISSAQLDDPRRGFSFQTEGPLDMRMDRRLQTSAAEIVNQFSEKALADLIYAYGEERYSRRIARAIVARRPLRTTTELADLIVRCYPKRRSHRIHPATRTFQALRIYVNDELNRLPQFLNSILAILGPGGRAVIISFHSLEDRLVKQTFREWQRQSLAHILTPHVITAGEAEQKLNPRSRSAKLRAAERVGAQTKAEIEK